jgi:hypothetical protein
MPLDGQAKTELIPRATVEEIVAYRNKALELYGEAFTAIEAADKAMKAAHAMASQAAGGVQIYVPGRDHNEVAEFESAVKLPGGESFQRVARRLTDMRVWQWVIQRTDLERLMDKEAKDKLHQQMKYLPDRVEREYGPDGKMIGKLITPEEAGEGMPPVTVENIYATIQQFALDADSIFRRGIANAFSKLDRRFKSHDGFKIGSRIILKYAFSSYSGGLDYGPMRDTMLDIERAFVVLDSKHLGASYGGAVGAIQEDRRQGGYGAHQSCTETEYFRVRGYQNGNAHLWFTRDDLVGKVNKLLAEWYGEVIGDGQQHDDVFSHRKTTPARRFGFFPTPDAVAETLIGKVPLWRKAEEPPLTILEPSAGTGNLARRCATIRHESANKWGKTDDPAYSYSHKVDCVEIQPELARQLRAEGIYRKVHCADFLQMQPDPARLYDRVVMNPPFDLERDIDHITHAMKFLKPDGYLIAIVSAGTEFRETKKAQAFRALVKSKNGRFEDLPAGSFSSVGTNVNTMMVRLWNNGHSVHW